MKKGFYLEDREYKETRRAARGRDLGGYWNVRGAMLLIRVGILSVLFVIWAFVTIFGRSCSASEPQPFPTKLEIGMGAGDDITYFEIDLTSSVPNP